MREEFLPVVQPQQTHARALRRAAIQVRVLQQGKKLLVCTSCRALARSFPGHEASGPAGLRSSPGAIERIDGAFGPGPWLLFVRTGTFRGDTYMLIIARCTSTPLSARIILGIYGLGTSGGVFGVCSFNKKTTLLISPILKGCCST